MLSASSTEPPEPLTAVWAGLRLANVDAGALAWDCLLGIHMCVGVWTGMWTCVADVLATDAYRPARRCATDTCARACVQACSQACSQADTSADRSTDMRTHMSMHTSRSRCECRVCGLFQRVAGSARRGADACRAAAELCTPPTGLILSCRCDRRAPLRMRLSNYTRAPLLTAAPNRPTHTCRPAVPDRRNCCTWHQA